MINHQAHLPRREAKRKNWLLVVVETAGVPAAEELAGVAGVAGLEVEEMLNENDAVRATSL